MRIIHKRAVLSNRHRPVRDLPEGVANILRGRDTGERSHQRTGNLARARPGANQAVERTHQQHRADEPGEPHHDAAHRLQMIFPPGGTISRPRHTVGEETTGP